MNYKTIFDNKIGIEICGHCVDVGSVVDFWQSLLCQSSRSNHYPVCCVVSSCVLRLTGTAAFDLFNDSTVKGD
jgi:hypothetical protein